MVHIDAMSATFCIAKTLMAVSNKTLLDVSAISNIQFTAVSCHDGIASSMCNKADKPKEVTFQDSVLLSGLQKDQQKAEIHWILL